MILLNSLVRWLVSPSVRAELPVVDNSLENFVVDEPQDKSNRLVFGSDASLSRTYFLIL